MDASKSNGLNADDVHVTLMKAIVRSVSSTPYVLKGGTALLLGYGLDRHSEDIDFASPKKLNILNRVITEFSDRHTLTLPEYPWGEICDKTHDRALEKGISEHDTKTFLATHSPLSALPSYMATLGVEVTPDIKLSDGTIEESPTTFSRGLHP